MLTLVLLICPGFILSLMLTHIKHSPPISPINLGSAVGWNAITAIPLLSKPHRKDRVPVEPSHLDASLRFIWALTAPSRQITHNTNDLQAQPGDCRSHHHCDTLQSIFACRHLCRRSSLDRISVGRHSIYTVDATSLPMFTLDPHPTTEGGVVSTINLVALAVIAIDLLLR